MVKTTIPGTNFSYEPYEGTERDIDVNKDWYCPSCSNKLHVNNAQDMLLCTENHHRCDYAHANKTARERYSIVWHKGYQYPITKWDVLRKRKQELIAQRESLEAELQENKKQLEKVTEELIN